MPPILKEILSSLSTFLEDKNKKRMICTTLNNNFKIIYYFGFEIDRFFKIRFASFGTLHKQLILFLSLKINFNL
jgi:hypothetical protein